MLPAVGTADCLLPNIQSQRNAMHEPRLYRVGRTSKPIGHDKNTAFRASLIWLQCKRARTSAMLYKSMNNAMNARSVFWDRELIVVSFCTHKHPAKAALVLAVKDRRLAE